MIITNKSIGDYEGIFHQKLVEYSLSGYNLDTPFINTNLFDGKTTTYYSIIKMWEFCEIQINNNKAISIHSYSILCGTNWSPLPDGDYPKMWAISGFDGNQWINVSVVIDSKLKTKGSKNTFPLDVPSPFFTKIRITCIGTSYTGRVKLAIACFDVFGEIGKLVNNNNIQLLYFIHIPISAFSIFFLLK